MKRLARNLAILSALSFLASGCASSRGGKGEPAVKVEKLAKTTRSWDGKELPAYPRGQPEIEIRRIRIAPGARLEMHEHPVINAGVLLSGELTVVKRDGKSLHLKAGDPIVELVNTAHYGMNGGKIPADIIVVYAGTVGTPVTIVETD